MDRMSFKAVSTGRQLGACVLVKVLHAMKFSQTLVCLAKMGLGRQKGHSKYIKRSERTGTFCQTS